MHSVLTCTQSWEVIKRIMKCRFHMRSFLGHMNNSRTPQGTNAPSFNHVLAPSAAFSSSSSIVIRGQLLFSSISQIKAISPASMAHDLFPYNYLPI